MIRALLAVVLMGSAFGCFAAAPVSCDGKHYVFVSGSLAVSTVTNLCRDVGAAMALKSTQDNQYFDGGTGLPPISLFLHATGDCSGGGVDSEVGEGDEIDYQAFAWSNAGGLGDTVDGGIPVDGVMWFGNHRREAGGGNGGRLQGAGHYRALLCVRYVRCGLVCGGTMTIALAVGLQVVAFCFGYLSGKLARFWRDFSSGS